MAATMSSELDNTDQLKLFYDDARAQRPRILPPDINQSDYRFTPNNQRRNPLCPRRGERHGRSGGGSDCGRTAKRRADSDLLTLRTRRQSAHQQTHGGIAHTRRRVDSVHPNRAMLLANIDLAIEQRRTKKRPMPTKAACLT